MRYEHSSKATFKCTWSARIGGNNDKPVHKTIQKKIIQSRKHFYIELTRLFNFWWHACVWTIYESTIISYFQYKKKLTNKLQELSCPVSLITETFQF
jgi:hypothetical protein